MKKRINYILSVFFLMCCFLPSVAEAQELNAQVSVVFDKIRGESPSTFKKMEETITEFLNTTHWTNIHYKSSERIDCKFLIDLQKLSGNQIYTALLTIQSARPVYNSSYESTILNHKDNDVLFYFDPYQPLIFDKNRVAGNNPGESNLTAILAYYAYLIIGLDQETFAKNGGHQTFETAQKIADEAPSGRGISGWKPFDGTNNRYWITENLLNVKYKLINDVFYDYHRNGLDNMYEDPDAARKAVLSSLSKMNILFSATPGLLILKVFFNAKANELAQIFSEGSPQDKMTALNMLKKLDPTHSSQYQQSMN